MRLPFVLGYNKSLKNKEMSYECETQYAGNGYYEVGCKGKRYVVSLEEMSCGCRM